MAAYLVTTITVFPLLYQDVQPNVPQPRIDVTISSTTVKIGQSFEIDIKSYNEGDLADMQTVSVAFPQSKNLDGIKVVSYDFMQSPVLIEVGDQIGSQYAASASTVRAQYPAIEAYSRPSESGDSFRMTLEVTPKEIGTFYIYTKSVAMPHTSDLSHFPASGILDHQDELVQQHTVEVIK